MPYRKTSVLDRGRAAAIALLQNAEVFRNRPASWAPSIVKDRNGDQLARLAASGVFSTGEHLVLKTAAYLAGLKVDGQAVTIDLGELTYRLSSGNLTPVLEALASVR
jgi:hypothetical protein